jgi:hypothetical protein
VRTPACFVIPVAESDFFNPLVPPTVSGDCKNDPEFPASFSLNNLAPRKKAIAGNPRNSADPVILSVPFSSDLLSSILLPPVLLSSTFPLNIRLPLFVKIVLHWLINQARAGFPNMKNDTEEECVLSIH